MKTSAEKFDRATLLKGGGTAALAAVFAGAVEGRADACCSPIDLTYSDDPVQTASARVPVSATQRKKMSSAREIKALRLWAEGSSPYPDPSWTLLYSIPNSNAQGNDENGKGHGQAGKNGPPQHMGYTIYVFMK